MTEYELQVRETDLGELVLVELAGELDLTNAEELERRLDELAADVTGLVIDLNRIRFIDSAALHVLFRLARRLGQESKHFSIVLAPSADVTRTVSIVGLDQAAEIAPSVDAALAQLGS
jgi:anti-anti-sigma factor